MKPLATVIGLVAATPLFFAVGLCSAQEKKETEKNPLDHPGCKSYFMIFWEDSHIPGGVLAHWEKSQEKWYLRKGVKKYPSVCMDAKKATYLLVYTTEEHTLSVTEWARVEGGSAIADNSDTPVGSVNSPATRVPLERAVQRQTVYMYLYTTGNTPFLSGGKPSARPLEVSAHTEHKRAQSALGWTVFGGMAGLSNPARDAFEDSIRFVANTGK
jgi:hypothetical protein